MRHYFFLLFFLPLFAITSQAQATLSVQITSPQNNSHIQKGSTVGVNGIYSCDQSGYTLYFYVDGAQKGTQGASQGENLPFSFPWNTTNYAEGTHSLTVQLYKSGCDSASSSVTVILYKIVQSDELWWFDGADAANYAEEITLTAIGLSSGTFNWQVTQGSDKVSLINPNSNPVTVRSIGASTTEGDIHIKLTHNGNYVTAYNLTVYTPSSCSLESHYPDDLAWGLYGYKTVYEFTLKDQFGTPIPNLEVNEVIGPFTNDYSPCWGWPDPWTRNAWTANEGKFKDEYKVSVLEAIGHPSTTWPGESGWDTPVRHATQWYRGGSLRSGIGKLFKQHTIQLFRGCARQI